MNSDHDEYNSSISVDSRACSSMVGTVDGEQAKEGKGSSLRAFLEPISFAKPELDLQ